MTRASIRTRRASKRCEDCGADLPIDQFDGSPLCGGRIDWYTYHYRRKTEADASGDTIR